MPALGRETRVRFRNALLTTHLWAGLVAAPFLLVLGITGAEMVFENEINDALNAKVTRAAPMAALPRDRRVAVAHRHVPLQLEPPGHGRDGPAHLVDAAAAGLARVAAQRHGLRLP
jgi:hypothetical protein